MATAGRKLVATNRTSTRNPSRRSGDGSCVTAGFASRFRREYGETAAAIALILGSAGLLGCAAMQTLKADSTIQGVRYQAGTEVQLSKDGSVEVALLSGDTVVAGVTYKAGTKVAFNKNGSPRVGTLKADTTIKGNVYGGGTDLWFAHDGVVGWGVLAAGGDATIEGNAYRGGTDVFFNEDGSLWIGTLAADTVIGGVSYKAGMNVLFEKSGTSRAVTVRITRSGRIRGVFVPNQGESLAPNTAARGHFRGWLDPR
jgi:hypothetical protein